MRWQALRATMAAEELYALLVCANDTRGEKGALRYVAEYRPFHRFGYALLPRDGAPALILHPVLAHAARSPWIERHVFTASPGRAIAELLGELPRSARIGTINPDAALRLPDWHALAAFDLVDAGAAFEGVRAIKSPAEIASLEQAAEIADRCFDTLIEIARPGLTDMALNAALSAIALAHGAEETLFLTMRAIERDGGMRALLSAPGPAPITVSDACIFSIELAGCGGHWIELARPLLFPGASTAARETAEATFAALAAARDAARPGAQGDTIQRAILGASDPVLYQVENASGHAIGQDIIEAPRIAIVDASQPPFRAGMALTIHPMLTRREIPALGYCADTYLLAEDGPHSLSRIPALPWEMPG